MRRCFLLLAALVIMSTDPLVHAQGSLARKPFQELVEALGRFAGRKGGSAADELAKLGGETTVRRVSKNSFAKVAMKHSTVRFG